MTIKWRNAEINITGHRRPEIPPHVVMAQLRARVNALASRVTWTTPNAPPQANPAHAPSDRARQTAPGRPWQTLYFLPDPHGHGELRPGSLELATVAAPCRRAAPLEPLLLVSVPPSSRGPLKVSAADPAEPLPSPFPRSAAGASSAAGAADAAAACWVGSASTWRIRRRVGAGTAAGWPPVPEVTAAAGTGAAPTDAAGEACWPGAAPWA